MHALYLIIHFCEMGAQSAECVSGERLNFAQLFNSGDTAQQCPLVTQISYTFPKITLFNAPVGLPNDVTIITIRALLY